jgi:hypothetical protein
MPTLEHALTPSRTHRTRFYRLTPVLLDVADAYLVIQQGEVGPRGGTSKLDVEAYFVQEVHPDPEHPFAGRVFLLAKDSDAEPDVYEVTVAPRGQAGLCGCHGYRATQNCKHIDTFYHLVLTVGYGRNVHVA